MFIHAFLQIIN